jgi:hypothetical protein
VELLSSDEILRLKLKTTPLEKLRELCTQLGVVSRGTFNAVVERVLLRPNESAIDHFILHLQTARVQCHIESTGDLEMIFPDCANRQRRMI